MEKVFEALDKLEECANGMKDLPKSNWIDLANNQAELDLKIMDWVETIKFELFKGKQAIDELKHIKEAKPSEAMECLEEIIHEFNEPHIELSGEYSYKNELLRRCENEVNTINQALLKAQEQEKALEIIKNKTVSVFQIKCCKNALEYNDLKFLDKEKLTEEEFDLVRKNIQKQ